jgi:hypothetical protein
MPFQWLIHRVAGAPRDRRKQQYGCWLGVPLLRVGLEGDAPQQANGGHAQEHMS